MLNADRVIRFLTAVTVVLLGAVAAVVSFRHAYAVVIAHGEDGLTAVLSPLTVDGMVFVAGLVILDAAPRGQRAPKLAVVTLALGIAATVAVNALYGLSHGPLGAVVAAWPAVALVLSSELLMGLIRRGQKTVSRDVNDDILTQLTEDSAFSDVNADISEQGPVRSDVKGDIATHLPAEETVTLTGSSDRQSPVVATVTPTDANPRIAGDSLSLAAPSKGAADGRPKTGGEDGQEGAETGRGFGRSSEASGPAQPVVVDVPSAVVSARSAGLSLQRIADEFGITKYQVSKILKEAEPALF